MSTATLSRLPRHYIATMWQHDVGILTALTSTAFTAKQITWQFMHVSWPSGLYPLVCGTGYLLLLSSQMNGKQKSNAKETHTVFNYCLSLYAVFYSRYQIQRILFKGSPCITFNYGTGQVPWWSPSTSFSLPVIPVKKINDSRVSFKSFNLTPINKHF